VQPTFLFYIMYKADNNLKNVPSVNIEGFITNITLSLIVCESLLFIFIVL